MRTTITLDADVEALVQGVMRERKLSFKQAVNAALRESLTRDSARVDYGFPVYAMGAPKVSLEHALRLAGELEDEEITRELASGR